MKVHLLYTDKEFETEQRPSVHEGNLVQDLRLTEIFMAMAQGDESLYTVAENVLLQGARDLETILYRQDILWDCLQYPRVVREIYDLMLKALEEHRKGHFGVFTRTPSAILYEAVKLLWMFIDILKQLRVIVDQHKNEFTSQGISRLFGMIQRDLTDDYIAEIENHLANLDASPTLIRAKLGKGNHGTDYTLLKPGASRKSMIGRFFPRRLSSYTFRIHPRDESGGRALAELKNRGINDVANALAQSAAHVLEFFKQLQRQLAFYVGCLNLSNRITAKGEPVCFPVPLAHGEQKYSFSGLYDLALSLSVDDRVVGNDLDDGGKGLVVITGANQGGKSTFLRSLGIAQLMMQSGMFVSAASFASPIYQRLFSHFRREEDVEMKSGKLDEELGRMNNIIDDLSPYCLLLCNESFAATNEREGTEIAKQITRALIEAHVKVIFVTHFYQYAHDFYEDDREGTMFLCAEREKDGTRTYKVKKGTPLKTSHGVDLYREVFESSRGSDRKI